MIWSVHGFMHMPEHALGKSRVCEVLGEPLKLLVGIVSVHIGQVLLFSFVCEVIKDMCT